MGHMRGEFHSRTGAIKSPACLEPSLMDSYATSPGRFFAATELKAMLAHLVVTYDLKFEEGKTKPNNTYIASACIPGKGEVMFRKRQT